MNRWLALVISATLCWAGAMACKGSGMPQGLAPVPGPDANVAVPKSLFIPVISNGVVQVYRVDVEPADATDTATKGILKAGSPVKKGYRVKSPIAAHLKHDLTGSIIGISPFNELVLLCATAICKDYEVQLFGSDSSVDVIKNRTLAMYGPDYDPVGDRLSFVVTGSDGVGHLIQRTMDGKESDLYQDTKLIMLPNLPNAIYLSGDKGIVLLNKSDGKIVKLSDSGNFVSGFGRGGDYILISKNDKALLMKSDASKSFDLPAGSQQLFYRPDLNEYIVYVLSITTDPVTQKSQSTKSVQKLDLQTGKMTTLYGGSLSRILDHVGDQYLVADYKNPAANQYSVQLSWLKSDGSLQDIVNIPTVNDPGVISYNPQNQTVLVRDGDQKLLLVSIKDAKVVATLNVAFLRMSTVFQTATDFPVLITFQAGSTPGQFDVGLISPDTLGGTMGTDLTPVSLGTIDTKDASASVASVILNSDIHDTKTRTPAAVADTTLAPVVTCTPDCAANQVCVNGQCEGLGVCTPDCTGKECGDNGCKGSCGVCDSGKACTSVGKCVVGSPPQIGDANFAGSVTMKSMAISGDPSKTALTAQTYDNKYPMFQVKTAKNDKPKSVTVTCGYQQTTDTHSVSESGTDLPQWYKMLIQYAAKPALSTDICTVAITDSDGLTSQFAFYLSF